MKELKRNEEGVSPVIATILMVAITVVLAATLYMMVGDIGGDDTQPLAGNITHDEETTFEIVSLQTPNSAEQGDLQITVIPNDNAPDGASEVQFSGDEISWSLLGGDNNDEVVGGSRFDVNETSENSNPINWDGEAGDTAQETEAVDTDNIDQDEIDEVVVRVDGYTGTLNYEM